MATAAVSHEIPETLVASAALYGISLPQIIAAVQQYGPVVIEVLQWVLDHLQQAPVGLGAINWSGLLGLVQKYGPVAIQVITWILTVVPK